MTPELPPSDSLLKQSPWLICESRFSRISDRDQITGILMGVKRRNAFLTLSATDELGTLFFDSFLLDVNHQEIRFYRSPKWPARCDGSFRVYFRNDSGIWHSMQVETDRRDDHTISAPLPDTIQVLRQRDCCRLEAPEGTRAAFIYKDGQRQNFRVLNISRRGALLCSDPDSDQLPVMSRIQRINIGTLEGNALPVVDHGQVVRCFRQGEKRVCYGITFRESEGVSDQHLWDFISFDEEGPVSLA